MGVFALTAGIELGKARANQMRTAGLLTRKSPDFKAFGVCLLQDPITQVRQFFSQLLEFFENCREEKGSMAFQHQGSARDENAGIAFALRIG